MAPSSTRTSRKPVKRSCRKPCRKDMAKIMAVQETQSPLKQCETSAPNVDQGTKLSKSGKRSCRKPRRKVMEKDMAVQETQLSSTQCDTSAPNSDQETKLTYRQNRRLQQATRAAATTEYYKRGPTRGLKSRRWRRKHPTEKPYAKISDSMRCVTGERAAEFISDCSRWVREYCPLKAINWVRMDPKCKERLYSKIQEEWNLPKYVDGVDVKVILKRQCAALYRGWRYRLKEKYYTGYSNAAAKANKPPEIDASDWNWLIDHYWSDPKNQSISEKNKMIRLKQTIRHSNGAKSTARILDEMMSEPLSITQPSQQDVEEGHKHVPQTQADVEPLYVRLYERTHRHAETGLDLDAEANLQALRDLHHKEIRENGVDNLTPHEAYSRVFKNPSGLKLAKSGVLGAAKVREKFQELEQASTQRESALHAEIQNLNAEIEKMKQESLERENKMKQEMIDRENKLRQDIIAEMAKIMRGSS